MKMKIKGNRTKWFVLASVLIAASLVWSSPRPALAGHLPIHGATTHLDPNGAGVFTTLPAGGLFGSSISTNFTDILNSPSLWHWETEIFNDSAVFGLSFGVAFDFPGGSITGLLGLSALETVLFDIHVQDNPPETGVVWTWTASSPPVVGIGLNKIDTSVTENLAAGPEIAGGYTAFFAGGTGTGSFGALDPFDAVRVRFTLSPVPEPCTLLLLGSGLAGIFMRRRKRLVKEG